MIEPPAVGTDRPRREEPAGDPTAQPAECSRDRQDLPGDRPILPTEPDAECAPAGPWSAEAWRQFTVETVVAAAKATEIGARGARVWNAALFAYAWMSVEDVFIAHRSRLSCRSVFGLLRLERDLAPRAVAELALRSAVLGRIVVQIGQDVAYPLSQRASMTIDRLSGEPSSHGA
jgi:hypothetical protein